MNKNKKGQYLLLGILAAVMIFIIGSIIAQVLKSDIITAIGVGGLDCDNPAISDGTKLTCLGFYLIVPYFIATILVVGIGLIIKPNS